MDDFEGTRLAMGTVTGLRAFRVKGGELRAPLRAYKWRAGENVATCIGGWYQGHPHRAGHKDCSCGFYGYYDGSNDQMLGDRVGGVVEAYGLMQYGPRGFRAEKAKIVALFATGGGPMRHAPNGVLMFVTLYATIWCAIAAAGIIFSDAPLYTLGPPLTISFIWLFLFGGTGGGFAYLRLRKIGRQMDVPVYWSQKRAVKNHPLTKPESMPGLG